MRRRRPGSITTFAILNIIFGGLFLICGVAGFADSKIESNGVDYSQQMKDALESDIPGYVAWKVGENVLQILLAVGFVACGIGMLNMQGWGRMMAIICAAGSILVQLFHLFFQLAMVNPALDRFVAAYRINFGGLFSGFATVWTVMTTAFVVIYNGILLIVMLQSGRVFAADYRGEPEDDRPPPRRERYEDDDDEDDRPRRRRDSRYDDDDDDDDRPRRRRRPDPDEDDDDRPRRRPPPRDDY
jgi:hypothetical protein